MLLIVRDTHQLIKEMSHKQGCCWSFIMGSLSSLALPPFHLWPLLIPTLSILFILVNRNVPRAGFIKGYWFGLGYFAFGLYWIAFALSVDLAQFLWLIPFSLLGIPAILSLYTGISCWLLNYTHVSYPIRWLLFAGLWGACEWLRGHLFTGFPWNLMGYSWITCPAMLQCTSVMGIYGLSVITILSATSPLLYINNHKKWFWGFIVIVMGIWGSGNYRLTQAPFDYVDAMRLRLVQPCIDQKLKWDQQSRDQNFLTHIKLSQLPSDYKITHIIWPEAAVPFFIEQDHTQRQQIAQLAPEEGAIILGGLRYAPAIETNSVPRMWNSLFALNKHADIVAVYDKSHLVPFGEYIPLRRLWPVMVKKITHGAIDFTPGQGLKTLKIKDLPAFSPLVCYEAIFPGQVTSESAPLPEWMLNLTNDAWYGNTSGPYQHFVITQVRAIEQGIPMVRVANNGISGVVDAYGRVVCKLDLNQSGVLDCQLPKALSPSTIYARIGDRLFFIIVALIALIGFMNWLRINRYKLK